MTEEVSIAKKVTAAAGTSGETSIYTVPAAAQMRIMHVRFYFPTGSQGYLSAYLAAGLRQLYPTHGTVSGDNTSWEFRTAQDLTSGSEITLHYANSDGTNSHTVWVLVEALLER